MLDLFMSHLLMMSVTLPVAVRTFNDTEFWRNVCPFSNSCTKGRLLEFQDIGDGISQPCCQRCSCDKDCWFFKDCCPDVTHERPADFKNPARCRTLTARSVSGDFNKYRVMDFCPSDYDVSNVISKCNGQINNSTTSLRDVVAVSDANDRIYGNRYCALCNGVTDVVSWKLQVLGCEGQIFKRPPVASSFIPALLHTVSLFNCILESVPPDTRIKARTDLKVCGLKMYYTCPSKTKSEIQHIVDECITGEPVLFFEQTNAGQVLNYKNVFCYLCRNDAVKQTICPVPADRAPWKMSFAKRSLVLDMTFEENIKRQSQAETLSLFVCLENELYDSVKGTCHKLSCPRFHAASYGRCLKFGSPVDNHGVELRIKYEPAEQWKFSEEIRMYGYQTAYQYVDVILRNYGLKSCDTMDFSLNVVLEKNTTRLAYVDVRINLLFDDLCLLEDISGAFRRRVSDQVELSLVINGVDVWLYGRITFFTTDRREALDSTVQQTEPEYPKEFSMHRLVNVHGPFANIDYDRDFFLCPYLVFDIQEYNAIVTEVFGQGRALHQSELSENSQVERGFYPLSTDVIAVCTDTYFALYKNQDQSGSVDALKPAMAIVTGGFVWVTHSILF